MTLICEKKNGRNTAYSWRTNTFKEFHHFINTAKTKQLKQYLPAQVSHRCQIHEGEGLFKNLMGAAGVNKVGAGAGLKMVLKNTCEGVHVTKVVRSWSKICEIFRITKKKAVIRIIYKSQQMLAGQNFSM